MAGGALGQVAYSILGRLRNVGRLNLSLAYPIWTEAQREQILQRTYCGLGWLLAEFCLMSRYTRRDVEQIIRYEGLEHYLAARDRGKGVLVLTGHLGAWELSSYAHSLLGYPMGLVIRRLDNPLVDRMVNRIRCLHGNHVIHKNDFARGLISAMHANQTVGILMDTNMTPPQGVFVPFFGVEACTASGLAKIALKTDAAVVPGFLFWDEPSKQYLLRFQRAITLSRSDDQQADIVSNTATFTQSIEANIREFPDQWLWMHRRWKTRPPGEKGIYQ